MSSNESQDHLGKVAVVGMAVRLPGARNVGEFWSNLRGGVESVTFFSDAELAAAGVNPALLGNPKYVKAGAMIEGVEMFDAPFFGINRKEAQLMDPQHRFFLECAWEALENAGYNAEKYEGRIGVYASESLNTYFLLNVQSNHDVIESMGSIQTILNNDRDFLATRTSFIFDLKGPSVVIQSACSSSLVAIHLACQSLNYGDCDMALTGGVSIRLPQKAGYIYQEGSIYSRDGHCRTFDAKATGTIGGNGVGVVLLKRLADAIRDGDHIHAVIRGSAVNNDGSVKIGYTAPSVDGQAKAIAEALGIAGVEPETINYVEAHGTATPLGDPIEIEALTLAYRHRTDKKNFCAIGSLKTNLGHLDAAAGVGGLIKTVLSIQHREIPPSLHFEQPNPKIDFGNSPFYVNAKLAAWDSTGAAPRRAGVSSFGIGGTNAHVVVEESPPVETTGQIRPHHLFVLSARSEAALDQLTTNLVGHLRARPDCNPADAAYTLQVGRKSFPHRRMLVCAEAGEAVAALESRDPRKVFDAKPEGSSPVVFMFPGQGAQHVQMGRELYDTEPVFRAEVDRCAQLLKPALGLDLRGVIYPEAEHAEEAAQQLGRTELTQPAIFVVEYALAKVWMSWGVRPEAMIGHSLGEYVAACLAGVFTLEEALSLVAARAQLMQRLPGGAMLGVQLPEDETRKFLNHQLSIAAVNAPAVCVVSGTEEAVAELQKRWDETGVACRRLHTSHAFHSPMMNDILEPFARLVKDFNPKPPRIPYISNLTGKWITSAEATDPAYWTRHLRDAVRFADGLGMLLKKSQRLLLEVGPGHTLGGLAKRHPGKAAGQEPLASLPVPQDGGSEAAHLMNTLGRLWLAGVDVDWPKVHAGVWRKRRVPLPTYPFEHQRYWLDPVPRTSTRPEHAPAASAQPNGHAGGAGNLPARMADAPAATAAADIAREFEVTIQPPSVASPEAAHVERVEAMLKSIINELTGVDVATIDTRSTFYEYGVDSLLLIQASQSIQKQFGIELSFRQLLEEYPSFDALANYLAQHWSPAPAELTTATTTTAQTASVSQTPAPPASVTPEVSTQPAPHQQAPPTGERFVSVSDLERMMTELFGVVSQQIASLLQGRPDAQSGSNGVKLSANGSQSANDSQRMSSVEAASPLREGLTPPVVVGRVAPQSGGVRAKAEGEAFVPFRPISVGGRNELTAAQQQHLASLIERSNARTQKSKQMIEESRASHADSRMSLNYRQIWKEIVYPIVGERSRGSRVWDADGNEYVDYTMGFGVNLFGHSPAFVVEALREQLELGMQLGPQAFLAGDVSKLLCELTGMERAAFCNSGTEAVMAALRLARAVTGRNKVVMFAGSYHGSFDGTLARAIVEDGVPRPVPVAPGVPPNMVEDLLVLEYDNAASLDMIRAHAHELAAVLVEPVQSRQPQVQPAEFLRQLRRITEESGVLLIFDEVITGFRLHPGGAQAWFDVRADLATYGKILGGGLPVGAVAGKAAVMNAVDGGLWNFGDDTSPQARQTYFAGTFYKNPLTLAAARAVLTHLKDSGEGMQRELNERTARLAARFNEFFAGQGLGIYVVHCGSLFRFAFPREVQFADLFFYHLVAKGIYVWEGRNCFLSTAHTDDDIEVLFGAVEETIAEMRAGDCLPPPAPTSGHTPPGPADVVVRETMTPTATPAAAAAAQASSAPKGDHQTTPRVTRLPLTEGQQQVWLASGMSAEASAAYNESVSLYLRGPLNVAAMQKTMTRLVARHEALRTSFSPQGDYQEIAGEAGLVVPLIDFSHERAGREARVEEWLKQELSEPFELTRSPLMRALIVRLEDDYHLLVLKLHHIVMDGWSAGVLLRELREIYAAECQGREAVLAPPESFTAYARRLAEEAQGGELAEDEAYWLGQFADRIPVLDLPTHGARAPVLTYGGARRRITIEGDIAGEVRRLSASHGSTTFVLLLSVFNTLLRRLTAQDDLIVGIHSAGQLIAGAKDLVGHCTNLLPFRTRIDDGLTFAAYLAQVKAQVLDAYGHQKYPLGRLIKKLNPPRDAGRAPLIAVTFNVDRAGTMQQFHELEVEAVTNHNGRAKFELSVNIVEWPESLAVECDYNTALFDGATITRWLANFEVVLRAVVADPDVPLTALAAVVAESDARQQSLADQEFKASRLRKLKNVRRKAVG